jgi:hypothetical protein
MPSALSEPKAMATAAAAAAAAAAANFYLSDFQFCQIFNRRCRATYFSRHLAMAFPLDDR